MIGSPNWIVPGADMESTYFPQAHDIVDIVVAELFPDRNGTRRGDQDVERSRPRPAGFVTETVREDGVMDVNILLPQLGNEIEEAQIDAWLKKPGDTVEKDEQLVVITTPKVTLEIEAPAAGTLKAILVEAEEIAPVGAILGVIETR